MAAKIPKPRLDVRPPPAPDAPHASKAAFVGAPAPVAASAAPVPPAPPSSAASTPGAEAKGLPKRRVNMLLPPDVVRRLRHLCADTDKDMTTATTEALEVYLVTAGYPPSKHP